MHTGLMFQPQTPAIDNQGIKPLPKIDENRAIKKPDTTASRRARAAYEPVELPSSYTSGLFKVSESETHVTGCCTHLHVCILFHLC